MLQVVLMAVEEDANPSLMSSLVHQLLQTGPALMNRAGTVDRMMRECDSPSASRRYRKNSLDKRTILGQFEESLGQDMILGGIQADEVDPFSELESIEQAAIGDGILRVPQTLEVRADV